MKPAQPKKLGLLKWNKSSGFASLFLYKDFHEMNPYDKCCALETWIVKLTQLHSIENEKSKAMYEDSMKI